jgi:hypothetical protein
MVSDRNTSYIRIAKLDILDVKYNMLISYEINVISFLLYIN